MEKVRLVKSQEIDMNQDQNYKNIKKDFEKRLLIAKNESEFITLIFDVNNVLKTHEFDQKEKSDLRNFRQKIYDRKKKFQENQTIKSQNININKSDYNPTVVSLRPEENASRSDQNLLKNHQDFVRIENSDQDFRKANEKNKILDFLFLSKNIFSILMFGICTFLTGWFVWKQSIPLYEAVGFPDPKFCALGAILMIVGFATIYSLTKSKIVLLLCIYASVYEIILIANGTLTHDSIQMQKNLESNIELSWLKEKAQHSEQSYQEIKSKFDDPTSKVFQNAWFKEKYLTPAWEGYSSDKNKVLLKLNQLNAQSKSNKDSFLKILFRLGLVFLCMVSVHNFFKSLDLKNLKLDTFGFQTRKEMSLE